MPRPFAVSAMTPCGTAGGAMPPTLGGERRTTSRYRVISSGPIISVGSQVLRIGT